MNIAIIGTGNIGGTLAKRFADNEHAVFLGVRNTQEFKGKELLAYSKNIIAHTITEAVSKAEVIVIAVPAQFAHEAAKSLGDVSGKVIIDTMNGVFMRPEGFTNTSDAILANCNSSDVVKCFNSTGFENILNPIYNDVGIDTATTGMKKNKKYLKEPIAQSFGCTIAGLAEGGSWIQ